MARRALLLLMALGALAGCAEDPVPGPAPATIEVTSYDDVIGLGRSEEARRRDDQVAAYGAWLHQDLVQDCMTAHGHFYARELHYPEEFLEGLELAEVPDAPEGDPVPPTAEQRNAQYLASLDEKALRVYYKDFHGGLPPDGEHGGADDGGCVGKAREQLSGPGGLGEAFEADRLELDEQELLDRYREEIAAHNALALERLERSHTDAEFAAAVQEQLDRR